MQSGLRRLLVAISESIQSLRLRMHESNTYCKLEKACYQNLRLGMQFHRIKSIVKPCFPGGHSLIRPIRVCAAGKGMVFKVLSLKLGIQFHQCLEQGVFLDWRPFKECEICNTNIFS